MSFSYSGDPSASSKDAVRFLTGDTDATKPLNSDEEIAFCLVNSATIWWAAVMAVDTIISKYGKFVQRTVGSLTINLGDRGANYERIGKRLRRLAALKSGMFIINTAEDHDQYFSKGMHDIHNNLGSLRPVRDA